MTAYASEQAAIDAVNLGAFAYVMKHCKNDEYKMFIRNALALRNASSENQQLKTELKKRKSKQQIIGQSTRIYDRENDEILYGRIPAGSVVVSGNLPSKDGKYSLYCAVIVKRVDERTRSKVGINELLRDI